MKSIGVLPTAHPATDASRSAPAAAAVVIGERTAPRRCFAELITPRPLALAGERARR